MTSVFKMSVEHENFLDLKNNMKEWRFCEHPKYIKLPIGGCRKNDENSEVRNIIFSEENVIPLNFKPRLVCVSEDALKNILDMNPAIADQDEFIEFISGNRLPNGSLPVAHRYGGHQFGAWAGQMGDGRAHLLGEYVNRKSERWQLQLKGSGQTMFARNYDGRSVLRSAIREMVASEACHFLNIPTTRAAALIVSNDTVTRDEFYNGLPKEENAAILLRLSPCWFRIGSLEILTRNGEISVLRQLCDFIIKEHYTDIPINDENRYIRLFSEIAHRTIDLVAKWQGYGFAHGVLNTDNISLFGINMDYGPFGFVDFYDSGFIPNCSDKEGRYSLSKQPEVIIWNLSQLASAMSPLLSASQRVHLSHILKTLDTYCKNKILEVFLLKLGVREERWKDEQMVEKLLEMMQQTGADFTMTFNQLSELEPSQLMSATLLQHKWALKRLSTHSSWVSWAENYRDRMAKEWSGCNVEKRMMENAFKTMNDAKEVHQSMPFHYNAGSFAYALVVEACSTTVWTDERMQRMQSVNPRYVPRNWMLHEAIQCAENNDFSKVRFLLEVFKNPFKVQEEAEKRGFASQPPKWAHALKVSCSS